MSLIGVQIKVILTMLIKDMVKNHGFDVINNTFIITSSNIHGQVFESNVKSDSSRLVHLNKES